MYILYSWRDHVEVNSLDVTTGHVVFHEIFVSVNKLEAVPILCVEWLVSPLFA